VYSRAPLSKDYRNVRIYLLPADAETCVPLTRSLSMKANERVINLSYVKHSVDSRRLSLRTRSMRVDNAENIC